jgi:hypothetical protein
MSFNLRSHKIVIHSLRATPAGAPKLGPHFWFGCFPPFLLALYFVFTPIEAPKTKPPNSLNRDWPLGPTCHLQSSTIWAIARRTEKGRGTGDGVDQGRRRSWRWGGAEGGKGANGGTGLLCHRVPCEPAIGKEPEQTACEQRTKWKSLVWFLDNWWNLWTNPWAKCVDKRGWSNPSGGARWWSCWMVMTKRWSSAPHWKRRKRKIKTRLIKAKV